MSLWSEGLAAAMTHTTWTSAANFRCQVAICNTNCLIGNAVRSRSTTETICAHHQLLQDSAKTDHKTHHSQRYKDIIPSSILSYTILQPKSLHCRVHSSQADLAHGIELWSWSNAQRSHDHFRPLLDCRSIPALDQKGKPNGYDKIMVGRLVNPSYLSLWHIMTLTLITLVRTYQVYQHIFSGSILTRLRLTGHLSPMLANQLPPDVEAVWVDSMAFFLLFLLRKRQCQSKHTQQFSDMLRVRSPFYHFRKCYSNQRFQSSATHFPCWFSLHGTCLKMVYLSTQSMAIQIWFNREIQFFNHEIWDFSIGFPPHHFQVKYIFPAWWKTSSGPFCDSNFQLLPPLVRTTKERSALGTNLGWSGCGFHNGESPYPNMWIMNDHYRIHMIDLLSTNGTHISIYQQMRGPSPNIREGTHRSAACRSPSTTWTYGAKIDQSPLWQRHWKNQERCIHDTMNWTSWHSKSAATKFQQVASTKIMGGWICLWFYYMCINLYITQYNPCITHVYIQSNNPV